MYFGKQPFRLSGINISYSENSESLNYEKACLELKVSQIYIVLEILIWRTFKCRIDL